MTGPEVRALLVARGVLLESAKGPIDNVAALVAGEAISGSWWGHPAGHAIFNTINELADADDVIRLKLVKDRITLVHARLWPALARLADRYPPARLTAIDEEHTSSGAHRKVETPFPEWMTPDALADAAVLSEADALALLPECTRP